jgi:hypothetical protein
MRRNLVALAAYLGLSFLYLGIPVAGHPGRHLIGYEVDPEIFVWSLAWWPHAILHWQNPIVTHAIWAPVGANLAWATSIPGLALLTAPVTLIAGPAFSYNLLAVALPALAAWTAFLLCRYVTGSFWASLPGGYLFGFSPYMFGQTEGHMHMTSVFLVPLVALVVLRFLDGRLSKAWTTISLGVLIAFQLSFSTEVALTLTVVLAVGLLVAFAVVPSVRERLKLLLLPLAGGYVLAAVFAAPLLYFALTDWQHDSINSPAGYPADLANIVIPTRLTWIGWHWTKDFAKHFAGNDSENGAYLGIPCLAILGWYAWAKRRSAGARYLTLMLVLGVIAELGTVLHIRGKAHFTLPWSKLAGLPGFNNVLPVRLSMFVALGAGVAVASWAASRVAPRWARVALPALAMIAIMPSLWNSVWHETPKRYAFFTQGAYHSCLDPGENVLAVPLPRWSDAMLWQAESGFAFRMADGYIRPGVPDGIPEQAYVNELQNTNLPGADWKPLVAFAKGQGATMILLESGHGDWTQTLAPVTSPSEVGGVELYSLKPNGRSACTAGSPAA